MSQSKTVTYVVVFLLAMSLLAAACNAAPAPVQTQIPATQAEAAPSPTAAVTAYPQPVVESSPAPLADPNTTPYPMPVNPQVAEWSVVEAFVMSGQVVSVLQGKDLSVTLTLLDGRVLISTQPAADEVLKIIQQCGTPCANIQVTSDQ